MAEVAEVLDVQRAVQVDRVERRRLVPGLVVGHAVLAHQVLDVDLDRAARQEPHQEERQAGHEQDRRDRLEQAADEEVAAQDTDQPPDRRGRAHRALPRQRDRLDAHAFTSAVAPISTNRCSRQESRAARHIPTLVSATSSGVRETPLPATTFRKSRASSSSPPWCPVSSGPASNRWRSTRPVWWWCTVSSSWYQSNLRVPRYPIRVAPRAAAPRREAAGLVFVAHPSVVVAGCVGRYVVGRLDLLDRPERAGLDDPPGELAHRRDPQRERDDDRAVRALRRGLELPQLLPGGRDRLLQEQGQPAPQHLEGVRRVERAPGP